MSVFISQLSKNPECVQIQPLCQSPKSYNTMMTIWSRLFCFSLSAAQVLGHARLIEPPSRTSAWRFGFDTPEMYNDHETNCGGFERHWEKNGGKCGPCGDAWDLPIPRDGESGGKYGRGVIVRNYIPGQTIRQQNLDIFEISFLK